MNSSNSETIPESGPGIQSAQSHPTELEIVEVAFGEATLPLRQRALAHAEHCGACRELIRFYEEVASEAGESVRGKILPVSGDLNNHAALLRAGADAARRFRVVESERSADGWAAKSPQRATAWAAESPQRRTESVEAIKFSGLNAAFRALATDLERRGFAGELMDPCARPWFRACHALVHGGAQEEECCAELLGTLGSLPAMQGHIAKLHHEIALELRARDRSLDSAAEALADLAAQFELPPGLVRDIAQELLTDPALLLEIIATSPEGALWHGNLRPAESECKVAGVLIEEPAGGGEPKTILVFLTVELVSCGEPGERSLRLHPVPAIALWDRGADFREAEEAAATFAEAAMREARPVEVRWRLTRYVEGPLPARLCGSSLGFAFGFLLRHLLARPDEQVARVSLGGLAIFGGIARSGEALAAGAMVPKILHREHFHTALMPVQPIGHSNLEALPATQVTALRNGSLTSATAELFSTPGGAVHVLQVADVETGAAALELEHQTRWQGFDFALPAPQPDFVGRASLTGGILHFLRNTDSGYGMIVGGMGSGKTCFMKQTIRRLAGDGWNIAFHLVPSQPGAACRAENLAKRIYFHLRRMHLTPEPIEWADWDIVQKLGELLKFLGEKNAQTGRKDIILIDAADQLELPAGKALVPDFLPAELPPGILCVISSGPRLDWLRDRECVAKLFSIGVERDGIPPSTNDWDDVLRYLRRQQVSCLPESLIEKIMEHAEPPVFFTVVKRLAELNSGTLQADRKRDYLTKPELWAAPPEELVRRKLHAIVSAMSPDGTRQSQVWNIFGVLAVVREPVCEEVLAGLDLWESGLADCTLSAAASFFVPHIQNGPRRLNPYRFDHQSYTRVILECIQDTGRVSCHRMLATRCLEWRKLQGMARRYALRYAPAHLRRAGMWDELYHLLTDFDYLVERMEDERPTPDAGSQQNGAPQDVPQRLAWRVVRDLERALIGQPCFPENHRWRPAIEALHRAADTNAPILHESPELLVQQLYNDLIWDWSNTDLGQKLEHAMRTSFRMMLKRRSRPAAPADHSRRLIFKGHRKEVRCVALSPDETIVASASADSTVFLWAVGDGNVLRVFREHNSPVTSVAWSHDGRLIASLAEDVRIWRPETGESVCTLSVNEGATLAFSPVDETLAVAARDGSVRLFSAADGREIAVLRERGPGVRCIAFSSDGRLLAIGTGDKAHTRGTVELFDVVNRCHLRSLAILPYWVEAIGFCPDDKKVATGGGSKKGEVKVFSVDGGGLQRTLPIHRSGIFALAISQNGVLATGSFDYTVGLHDLETAARLRTGMGHCEVIRSVAISRNGELVISAGADHAVVAWHLGRGPALPASADSERNRSAHNDKIHTVCFSRIGTLVSTASVDGTARVYSQDSTFTGVEFKLQDAPTNVSVISPDGTRIAVASHTMLKTFDLSTGAELNSLRGHESWIINLAWTPDGSRIVSVSEDTMAVIWDARTGAFLHALKGHTARVRAVAISPDGRFVATAGDDARIHIWEIETGQLVRTLHGHERRIKALAWSRQGILASAGSDDFIKLWDPVTGRELGKLHGFSQEIWTLQFAPERYLAAGGLDGMARVFDIKSGKQVAAFPCADAVQALWFSEDGTELRIADRGGANLIPNIHVVQIVQPLRN